MPLAEDVARRAAVAIDNARLYRQNEARLRAAEAAAEMDPETLEMTVVAGSGSTAAGLAVRERRRVTTTASGRPTPPRRARTAASVSGWPSSTTSSCSTAAASRPRARVGVAARRSPCASPRPGAEHGRRVPAVALTAFARAEDGERALANGFALHVPKPVEPAALAEVVARLAVR